MADSSAPRRLIDLPGVDDLELKALMKPAAAEPENRAEFPEIDACSKAIFGLTGAEAEAVETPAEFDPIDHLSPREMVEAFAAEGWDVTDNKRRPLRMLRQLGPQLWLVIHGVAGELPFTPEPEPGASSDWGANLAADAAKFRRR
jgi:hypothetical protein